MTRPYNILVIMCDEGRARWTSAEGNTDIATPNLDAFIATATNCTNAYVANPVCSPQRTAMFLGHYPLHYGIRENGSGATGTYVADHLNAMCPLLQRGGYTTNYGGKVHFNDTQGGLVVNDYHRFNYFSSDATTGNTLASALATRLGQNRAQPWFNFASIIQPHDIEQMSAGMGNTSGYSTALNDAIAAASAPGAVLPALPANHARLASEPDWLVNALANTANRTWARNNWGDAEWKLHRWCYNRLFEIFDSQVGTILNALASSIYANNTIVIVCSEHGDEVGERELESKEVFFQGSMKIPLYIKVPGISARTETRLINWGIDFLPTLCDYARVSPPAGLPGVSIRPLIENTASSWRTETVVEGSFGVGATNGTHTYARSTAYPSGSYPESLWDVADGETIDHLNAGGAYAAPQAALVAAVNAHTSP